MPDYKLLGIKKAMIIAKTWEDSSFWVKGEGGDENEDLIPVGV